MDFTNKPRSITIKLQSGLKRTWELTFKIKEMKGND